MAVWEVWEVPISCTRNRWLYPHIWVQPHDFCCDRAADQGCRATTSCSTEEGSTAGQLLGAEAHLMGYDDMIYDDL